MNKLLKIIDNTVPVHYAIASSPGSEGNLYMYTVHMIPVPEGLGR